MTIRLKNCFAYAWEKFHWSLSNMTVTFIFEQPDVNAIAITGQSCEYAYMQCIFA